MPIDMLAHVVNRAAEPWQDLPNQSPLQKVQTVVQGVIGVLNMDVLVDAFNGGVALVTAPLNAIYPALPAATLTALHVGSRTPTRTRQALFRPRLRFPSQHRQRHGRRLRVGPHRRPARRARR
jgi:hypothetical protein